MSEHQCDTMRASGCLPWPLDWILDVLTMLILPCQSALSGLISLWLPTAIEKDDLVKLMVKWIILGPLYTTLVFVTLPLTLCFILLRCLLVSFRHPLQYSVLKNYHTQVEEDEMMESLSGIHLGTYRFGIASANVCLLPEFLARINKISHAGQRAQSTGERLVIDQFFYTGVLESIVGLRDGVQKGKNDVKGHGDQVESFVGGLATHFPRLDFLCLQEVFDWNYNKQLRQEFHKVFPYILHDIGVHSLKSNFFMLNSGLMFASRHPVLKAGFKFYEHSVSQCLFSSKGLLMVKVQIGEEVNGQRRVGYVYTTHLQAYQGPVSVILQQLDDIKQWSANFKSRTSDSRDVILFDILCGDFNFDNLSPGDKENREHSIFDMYHDPCRVIAGQDQPWAVGTEFKQIFMHEPAATTPDSLKTSLADPALRHRYLVDANIEEQSVETLVNVKLNTDHQGNIVTFPEAGMRRIDYILHGKDIPLDLTKFQFVTRLASLTDHIPVAMVFRVKA